MNKNDKKIILSLLIIGGVGASAVAGTQALLSDTAVLAANTVSTGSVDLEVSNTQSGTPPSTTTFRF